MPTRRGGLLAGGALVLAVCGRLFGIVELFMLAAGAGAAVAGSVAYVRSTPLALDARRHLRPPRVAAGAESRVDLSVHNHSARRRSPVVVARDPFDAGRRLARFVVAPLNPKETARAAYRLPTERRGVFDLGPLTLELSDPFGLARREEVVAPPTSLIVFPRVERVSPPPLTRGDEAVTRGPRSAPASGGDEFYALREYEQGDDLRRVHWKATARVDELMIRQEEAAWQGSSTILVDLRAEVHDPASLETALSAAASLAAASRRRRSPVRLIMTDGVDSGVGNSGAHLEAILERLARARATSGSLAGALAAARRGERAAAGVVITTSRAASDDLGAAAALRARTAWLGIVVVELAGNAVPGGRRAAAATSGVVRVPPGVAFATAWEPAVAGRAAAGVLR